uniref:Putative secreted peptide n=1 Tax=Anopheles braziliensis TaxID=58242 RepID=A0A2M3ZWD9_9DIPT
MSINILRLYSAQRRCGVAFAITITIARARAAIIMMHKQLINISRCGRFLPLEPVAAKDRRTRETVR